MSKKYILIAGLFWVCSIASAQVMLPAYQGVFGKKSGTVPVAPTSPIATAGNAQATVSFTAPASTGGSAITGYTVTSTPGGFTASGAASPLTVTGLSNGTSYTFTVLATNALGNSEASEASVAVTPIAPFVCGTSTVTFTYNGASVTYGTVSRAYGGAVGTKCWLDRNLGATRVATSSTDLSSYGHLFQWGRGADGHQIRTSGVTAGQSNSITPGNTFRTGSSNWYNGINPNNLWQGVSGANNPCPSGYRLPTEVEWTAERGIWSSQNSAGAFGSPLKLPLTGYRSSSNGSLVSVGELGYYWSSTISILDSKNLNIYNATLGSASRAFGDPVRCIKD
jgi:hypothetical protein